MKASNQGSRPPGTEGPAKDRQDAQKYPAASDQRSEGLIINEAQLLLAEKRTSLATLRTGITVLALPLAMVSLLIVASRYYEHDQVLGLLVPVLIVCAGLLVLGGYLVGRAILNVHRADRLLHQLKRRHSFLRPFIE